MVHGSDNWAFRPCDGLTMNLQSMLDGANRTNRSDSHLSSVLVSPDSRRLAMTIQQAEIAKNLDEIQAQAVELHKRFSIFIDKFNDIGRDLSRLNRSFNAAVGSAQSRLLPQGRSFAELAGQSGEIDVSDQIDEVVREIQANE